MKKPYLLVGAVSLAGSLVLAACGHQPTTNQSAPTGVSQKAVSVANGNGALVIKPQIRSGGFRLQTVTNYTAISINHLVIRLLELTGPVEAPVETQVVDGSGNPIMVDLQYAQLGDTIRLDNLQVDHTYRVWAYAYKAAGTAEADLISTNDSGSYTDVTIPSNGTAAFSFLKVKLIDVPVDGNAEGSFLIEDGSYSAPVGPATISVVPSPTPTPAPDPTPTPGPTAWSPATQYVMNDLVTYGGFTWIATSPSLNETPFVGSTFWSQQP